MSATGYEVASYGVFATGGSYWWAGNGINLLTFGRAWNSMIGVTLTPAEASGIDVKLDDGKPAIGQIRSMKNANCNTTDDEATAEYALTNSTISCVVTSQHLQQ